MQESGDINYDFNSLTPTAIPTLDTSALAVGSTITWDGSTWASTGLIIEEITQAYVSPSFAPTKISSAADLQGIGVGVQKLVLVDGTEIDVLVENRTLNGISKNWMLVAGFGNGTNYDKSLTQTLITDSASLGSAGFNSAEMAAFSPAADLTGDGIASCTFYGNPSNSHASAYLEGPAWNSNWPSWFSALGIVFTVNLSDAVGVTATIQPSIGTHTKTLGSDQHHIWNELAAENLTIDNTTGNLFHLIEDGRSNAGIAHTWVA